MGFILKDLGGRLHEIKRISPEEAVVLDQMAAMITKVRKDAVVWTASQAEQAGRQKLDELAAALRGDRINGGQAPQGARQAGGAGEGARGDEPQLSQGA